MKKINSVRMRFRLKEQAGVNSRQIDSAAVSHQRFASPLPREDSLFPPESWNHVRVVAWVLLPTAAKGAKMGYVLQLQQTSVAFLSIAHVVDEQIQLHPILHILSSKPV